MNANDMANMGRRKAYRWLYSCIVTPKPTEAEAELLVPLSEMTTTAERISGE